MTVSPSVRMVVWPSPLTQSKKQPIKQVKVKKEFKGSKFECETMSGVHEGNCFSPVPRLSAADRLYLSASDHD